MAIKLALGLVDEMVDYLTDNLQTHLTTEEEIWDDGITLAMPNSIIKRDPDDPRRMNNPPYLYVVVPRSQIYDWKAAYVMANHQLVLWLVAQNPDIDVLRLQVYRFGNTLWKCLVAADGALNYRMALPGSGVMPEMDFGETLTRGNVAMADVRLITWWSDMEV